MLCKTLDESYPFWVDIEQTGIDKDSIYKEYRDTIKNTKTDIEFFKNIIKKGLQERKKVLPLPPN